VKSDVKQFKLSIDRAWRELSAYSYLQVGMGDIVHILIAQHLGCSYLASLDSDFRRVKDIVKEETGMRILVGAAVLHDWTFLLVNLGLGWLSVDVGVAE
jgi:hypothetical protein